MWGQGCCRGEKCSRLLDLASPHLQDSEVVEGLCVTVVGSQGQPEALVRKAGVANGQTDVTDVVPYVA